MSENLTEAAMKPGAIVTLKSGGPVMTVERETIISRAQSAPKAVVCSWFDGTRKMKETFSVATLKHVNPSASS